MNRIDRAARAAASRAGATLAAAWLGAAWAAGADALPAVLASDAAPYHRACDALAAKLGRPVNPTVLGAGDDERLLAGARVVIAVGTGAAVWAHAHLPPDARLVYCMVADPDDSELAQPPAADGISTDVPLALQFGLIAEALPQARRIGVLHRRDDAGQRLVAQARAALPDGWSLETLAVDGAANADAIDDILSRRVDAVWTTAEGGVWNEAAVRALLLGALRRHVPVFGFSPAFVRAGALLGVGIDPQAQGEQAAGIIADLPNRPVGAPALRPAPRFEIAVNLIVARKLGIDLPAGLVERATHVFRPER